MNLRKHTEKDLLKLYAKIMEELRSRGVVRSGNNPVADYGEKVVSELLNLKLQNSSNRGFDAIDKAGCKYQIKARRITPRNPSRQLGVIRNLNSQDFDYLFAAIFDRDFNLAELWKIPHGCIKTYAKHSKHQNGHVIILRGAILKDKRVKNLIKLQKPAATT